MEKTHLLYRLVSALGLCTFGYASTLPSADSRLLSLVPPGAALVGGLTQGPEVSYMVLNPNNQTDLMDLQSISGVDPTRTIQYCIFVATSGSPGFMSEHSLLAFGHFDAHHIFEAARGNGASESKYLGIPVLVVQPLKRDKGISDDVRWLAFIDSQIAVFGTISMVQEELGRYLARSPADTRLMWRISRLRSTDQSWCV